MFSGLAYLGCDCQKNKSMSGLADPLIPYYIANPNDAPGTVAAPPGGASAGSTFDLSPFLNATNAAVGNLLQYKLASQKLSLDASRQQQQKILPVPVQGASVGPSPTMIVGLAAAGLGVIGLVLLLKRRKG